MELNNRRNFYRILHVQPDAPVEIIRSSYRTLMQKLKVHPDLGGSAQQAALLNFAFSIVTDPDKRVKYDAEQRLIANIRRPGANKDSDRGYQTMSNATSPSRSINGKNCYFCGVPQGKYRAYNNHQNCFRCQSPLSEPPQIKEGKICNRGIHRRQMKTQANFYTRWPQDHPYIGDIVNFSPIGVGMESSLPIRSGKVIKIECALLLATVKITNCYQLAIGRNVHYHIGGIFLSSQYTRPTGSFVSVLT